MELKIGRSKKIPNAFFVICHREMKKQKPQMFHLRFLFWG